MALACLAEGATTFFEEEGNEAGFGKLEVIINKKNPNPSFKS
jgi:hypothetical protein